MPKSHKIASRQAELARKKRKHFEPQHAGGDALQASASVEGSPVATAPQVPEEVRAKPSLMSSYRAVASQPETAKRPTAGRSATTSQTEYFSADLRRLTVTIVISLALLVGLTFALR